MMRMRKMGKGMLRRGERKGKRVLGMMMRKRVLVMMRNDLVGRHRVGKRMTHWMKVLMLVLKMKRNGHCMVGKRKRDRMRMRMSLEVCC